MAAADIADGLREGLESGDYSSLVGRYASDAQLDAGVAGERAVVVGPNAIARRFAISRRTVFRVLRPSRIRTSRSNRLRSRRPLLRR